MNFHTLRIFIFLCGIQSYISIRHYGRGALRFGTDLLVPAFISVAVNIMIICCLIINSISFLRILNSRIVDPVIHPWISQTKRSKLFGSETFAFILIVRINNDTLGCRTDCAGGYLHGTTVVLHGSTTAVRCNIPNIHGKFRIIII